MSRRKILPFLCAMILVVSAVAQPQNLVLNRPYDYWPVPAYGGPNECTDAGDAVQLTDGVAGGAAWGSKPTVGWSAGLNIPVVVRFDLGEAATLSELRFNTVGGGGAGVVDVGLRIYGSLDNQDYIPIGKRKPPSAAEADKGTRRSIQMVVPLNGAKARYVAVAAMAPDPYGFVFVDEIELMGALPADPKTILPIQPGIPGGSAKELQQTLAGGRRSLDKLNSLVAPIERHIRQWPKEHAQAQERELAALRARAIEEFREYDKLRAELTTGHRDRAREVYESETLVWEVTPDDAFTPLSLPHELKPRRSASIHTVISALEATALGAANLTDRELPLKISLSGGENAAPRITVRVGRFFVTGNARYVPDALLANDCPQVIPSGESKLIWLESESSGAKPGLYNYEVSVHVGEKTRLIPLKVQVHDVVLSRETPLSTGNWSDLNTGDGATFGNLNEVRDAMLSHRITVGAMTSYPWPARDDQGRVIRPLQLDFADLDKALAFHKDFPQISFFFGFNQHVEPPQRDRFGPVEWMSDEFKEIFREWIGAIIGRIRASGRDYDQFCFMNFDETLDEKVEQLCVLTHSADPNVRVMITVPQASSKATSGLTAAGMNIFCYHAPRLEYDNAPEGMDVLASDGRELWFYNAADAAHGVGKEPDPLGYYRYLHWTAFYHGATGVHFWNMLWSHGRSPVWTEEPVGAAYFPMVYCLGPGYPEPPDDVRTAETVIPSRRWQHVRMGIEDYMLLRMARERIDSLGDDGTAYRNQLDELIRTVLTNRAADRGLFRAKRKELVEMVEALAGRAS